MNNVTCMGRHLTNNRYMVVTAGGETVPSSGGVLGTGSAEWSSAEYVDLFSSGVNYETYLNSALTSPCLGVYTNYTNLYGYLMVDWLNYADTSNGGDSASVREERSATSPPRRHGQARRVDHRSP